MLLVERLHCPTPGDADLGRRFDQRGLVKLLTAGKWHCAGGCHVNHTPTDPSDAYDRLCVQTRIIALRNILEAMGQDHLAREWLWDREAAERSVFQSSDLLLDLEEGA